MNFIKQFLKSIFMDEFIVYLVDSEGRLLDGFRTDSYDPSVIIEEALEYFGRDNENYFLFY